MVCFISDFTIESIAQSLNRLGEFEKQPFVRCDMWVVFSLSRVERLILIVYLMNVLLTY